MSDIVPNQADREAAEDIYLTCFDVEPNRLWLDALLAGKHDSDPVVQAAARHRLAAERETIERCAAKLSTIEPDEDAAGGPANWSDFVQVAQSAIRATSSKDTIDD